MKKSYILVIALLISVFSESALLAQPWTYDFGTVESNLNSGRKVAV